MYKETITYTDYNGNERTEDFYFNLTEAELTDMNYSVRGGLQTMIKRIVDTQDTPSIAKIFKEMIFKSYGQKSDDGRRFIKSRELSEEFSQTEAYSKLYMKLATDSKAAGAFVNGIIPSDLAKRMNEESKAAETNFAENANANS